MIRQGIPVDKNLRRVIPGLTIQGIAVLTVTLLIVVLIPFVGPLAVIMTPLPIVYFFFRLGRMQGALALTIAFLIASAVLLLTGDRTNITVLAMICFTGAMLAEVLARRYPAERTFIIASLAVFFCGSAVLLAVSALSGVAPWQILGNHVQGILGEHLRISEQLNISADQIALIRENAQEIVRFFVAIFPALALSGAVLTVWVNVLAARLLLKHQNYGFPEFGDLSLWKAPERLVWLLIAAGVMMLLPLEVIDSVGMNFLIVCCLVYLLQGLAIVSFFFKRKRVPTLLRWLFYLLIAVQQYMVILVIAFGLFDLWIDFRKRIAGIKDAPA